ncbi:hypothetical protein [Phycicoccus sp. DTK01]|uniref:hypothetical protein n=1 Tax=Phycicoccus sp. DTK01 TaxID=2785745 RepID=UPI001A8DD028|nr:hypothetical protein [Phycicoccus sp. DTK01]GIL35671.1 hypothetical protein PDTK01_17460 [Phycicoccus sp. DTK01]
MDQRDAGGAVRCRGERGATAAEYVGIVLLVGVVIAALALTVNSSAVNPEIRRAWCLITGAGGGGCDGGSTEAGPEDTPTDEDFEPDKCRIHETGDKYSSVIKIGFIKIGENAGFVVTEYSDGTVTMMATNGSEIGATGGFGADAAWGQLEAGAKIDFGGGLKFDYGSTWNFESKAQADSFRKQLDDYLFDQWSMTHPVCGMGVCMPRPVKGVKPPPVPSTTFGGIAVTGEVNAQLGISATTGTAPLTEAKMTEQNVSGALSADSKWTVTNDNKGTPDDARDDTRTYVTAMTLNPKLTAQIGLATGGYGSMVGMSLAITKNADGKITQVKIVSTSEVTDSSGGKGGGTVSNGSGDDKTSGGGSISGGTTDGDVVVTENVLALDPSDAATQQVVTDWLGGSGNYEWPGLVSLGAVDPSVADPSDPFAMLMHTDATSSTVAYDKVTDVQGFALNVKFGLAFGADFSMESSETTATEAAYLGAPRPDGTRPVVPYEACVE